MQKVSHPGTRANPAIKGFALVLSLSLMSFILLMLLAFTTLTRVETDSSKTALNQLHAQQQAILGLQLALGELQKSTGPDQRVSAPADLLSATHESRANVVGVWSRNDQLINWLASDARDTNGTLRTDYNTYEMPDEEGSDSIVMVGTGSLTNPNSTAISAGKKIVLNTANTRTLGNNGEQTGRFAWWIGDEGTKAKINRSREQTLNLERSILELSSPSITRPDVLDGLSDIDFFAAKDASSLIKLADLELLEGGKEGIGNPYFHDLTTYSVGLMVDVKNGGLKKDLSLAFEMDDADFNASEFGSGGLNTINAPGVGEVQPIFRIAANGAHGPVWHLLRDYYRLYHLIENPWNDPKLDARVFGPNLNHSNSNLNLQLGDLNNAAATIDGQPAIVMAGGKAKFKTHAWANALISDTAGYPGREQNPEPDNAIDFAMHPDDPIWHANGDPLNGGGSMPIMLTANYMPYMMRFMGEIGVWFSDEAHPSDPNKELALLNVASRERFVMHNPYNVTIAHSDIAIDSFGGEFGFTLFDVSNRRIKFKKITTETDPDGNETKELGNINDTWVKQTRRRVNIEAGTLQPGEIKTYQAEGYQNSNYSDIITGSDTPKWHHYKLGGNSTNNNDGWLFEKPTDPANGLTLAIFGSSMNNHMVRSSITNGPNNLKEKLSFTTLFFSTHLREENGARNEETIQHHWPMASVIDTAYLFPGPEYDGTLNPNPSGFAYFFPEADDKEKVFPEYLSSGMNTLAISPSTVGSNRPNNRQRNAEPMLTIDVQLKPAEYDRTNTRYPAFTRSNPLAPVRDSKNLLPLDDFINDDTGFPKVSPDIAVDLTDASTMGMIGSLNTWGPTDGTSGGVTAPVLIELPTSPVLSIGKLQHANLSVHAHMPALAVANSLASVYIPPAKTYETYQNNYGKNRVFYDLSYLMNEALWDGYFFSSLSVPYDDTDFYSPVTGKVLETFNNAFETGTTPLPNPRNKLFTIAGEDSKSVEEKLFDGNAIKEDAYKRIAENLVCDGSFNVNSTSVDAWRTVLSGARDLSVYQSGQNSPTLIPNGSTTFLRHNRPKEGYWDGVSDLDKEAWAGFRSLSSDDIKLLAESIVAEIKIRARSNNLPYLSLGEFVNRELEDSETGRCGLLQAAINRAQLNDGFLNNSSTKIEKNSLNTSATGKFKVPDNILEAGISNATASMSAPTYLMQADILQAIGSFISVRSDTFKIRSYGDYRDPLTGEVLSEVWYEAIVQRIPEPVTPDGAFTPAQPEYWNAARPENPFGRRYKIISIRQLPQGEV